MDTPSNSTSNNFYKENLGRMKVGELTRCMNCGDWILMNSGREIERWAANGLCRNCESNVFEEMYQMDKAKPWEFYAKDCIEKLDKINATIEEINKILKQLIGKEKS